MLGQRWVVCLAIVACGLASAWGVEEAAVPWTPADTALANQSIQALERSPEDGRVLDLLGNLYEDHGQTRLLLQSFEEASKPEQAVAARVLHGHLLRRKGNSDQALDQKEHGWVEEGTCVDGAKGDGERAKRIAEAARTLPPSILGPTVKEWPQGSESKSLAVSELLSVRSPRGKVSR